MGHSRSLLGRPSFAWRAVRTLWLVSRLRCPSCGLGRMGDGFLALARVCAVCSVAFERDPGEVTGGIWMNSMATTGGICALAFWLEFSDAVPARLETPITIAFALVFPVVFYRHSRALWIGVLHLTGLVHRDEAADPEPVIRPWPPDPGSGGSGPAVPAPAERERRVALGAGRTPPALWS